MNSTSAINPNVKAIVFLYDNSKDNLNEIGNKEIAFSDFNKAQMLEALRSIAKDYTDFYIDPKPARNNNGELDYDFSMVKDGQKFFGVICLMVEDNIIDKVKDAATADMEGIETKTLFPTGSTPCRETGTQVNKLPEAKAATETWEWSIQWDNGEEGEKFKSGDFAGDAPTLKEALEQISKKVNGKITEKMLEDIGDELVFDYITGPINYNIMIFKPNTATAALSMSKIVDSLHPLIGNSLVFDEKMIEIEDIIEDSGTIVFKCSLIESGDTPISKPRKVNFYGTSALINKLDAGYVWAGEDNEQLEKLLKKAEEELEELEDTVEEAEENDEYGNENAIALVMDSFDGDIKLYKEYSGRGMFGKSCFGIVVRDNYEDLIDDFEKMGVKPKHDTLGLNVILYWPQYTYENILAADPKIGKRYKSEASTTIAMELVKEEFKRAFNQWKEDGYPFPSEKYVAPLAKKLSLDVSALAEHLKDLLRLKVKNPTLIIANTFEDFMGAYQYEINALLKVLHKVKEDDITDDQWDCIERKMKKYDSNVMETIQHWIPRKEIDAREVALFATDNQNRFGTEPKQVINALVDFLDCLGIERAEAATASRMKEYMSSIFEALSGNEIHLVKSLIKNLSSNEIEYLWDYINANSEELGLTTSNILTFKNATEELGIQIDKVAASKGKYTYKVFKRGKDEYTYSIFLDGKQVKWSSVYPNKEAAEKDAKENLNDPHFIKNLNVDSNETSSAASLSPLAELFMDHSQKIVTYFSLFDNDGIIKNVKEELSTRKLKEGGEIDVSILTFEIHDKDRDDNTYCGTVKIVITKDGDGYKQVSNKDWTVTNEDGKTVKLVDILGWAKAKTPVESAANWLYLGGEEEEDDEEDDEETEASTSAETHNETHGFYGESKIVCDLNNKEATELFTEAEKLLMKEFNITKEIAGALLDFKDGRYLAESLAKYMKQPCLEEAKKALPNAISYLKKGLSKTIKKNITDLEAYVSEMQNVEATVSSKNLEKEVKKLASKIRATGTLETKFNKSPYGNIGLWVTATESENKISVIRELKKLGFVFTEEAFGGIYKLCEFPSFPYTIGYEKLYFGIQLVFEDKNSDDSTKASKFGDVKGKEPAEKDIQRMKDLKTKAKGDEAKMLKLAQNMANTLGVSPDSLDKAFRRAKAAEMVYSGPLGKKIAKIFRDISINNKSAANTIPDNYLDFSVAVKEIVKSKLGSKYNEEEVSELIEKEVRDGAYSVEGVAEFIVDIINDNKAEAKTIDWEELGKFNKQTAVTVGNEDVTIDVIKDDTQVMSVECSKFDISYPLDSVSFDRAMIAAEKFINALTPEIIQDETKTKELLWAMFGQNTGAAVMEEYKGIEIKTGFDSSSEIITLYIDGAFYHGGPEFKNDAEAIKYAKSVIDNNPTYYTESSINEDISATDLNKAIKKFFKDNGLTVFANSTGTKNPYITVVSKTAVIPNEIRIMALIAQYGENAVNDVNDKDNVNYGNIGPNSIALKKKEWMKVLNKSTASTLTDKEQSKYDAIKNIVDEGQYAKIEGVTIDGVTANLLLKICNNLNEENKKKFLSQPIRKMVDIGWKLAK